jgi:hypothetical protein
MDGTRGMDGKEGMEKIFSSFHQLHEQANLKFYASLSRRNDISINNFPVKSNKKV